MRSFLRAPIRASFRHSYRLPAVAALTCLGLTPAAGLSGPGSMPVVLSYRLNPGESLRYKLTADIHGSVPIADSPPQELSAGLTVIYVATPKTRLADGTMDVDLNVEKAELEVEKIPFPLDTEQAQKILNQTVTLAKTGEVKRVSGGDPVPFSVSVPGVDPKRLYALLFPVVFQERPVKPGDSWKFKSELLGGGGTNPVFTATVLPAASVPASTTASKQAPMPPAGWTRLGEAFSMDVDQKLDAEKKPITDGRPAHRTRQGRIEGDGVFVFDRVVGHVTRGTVNIRATVSDKLVGAPLSEDEPKELASKVAAKVTIELQPAGGPPQTPGAKEKP